MKTLKFASTSIQAEKFIKTNDSIIAYVNDVESARIHPLSHSYTYTIYNEDETVSTFDEEVGIISSAADLLKLVYVMMNEIDELKTQVADLQTKVGGN